MDSKSRFSNRVADYVKYRPDYPLEILDYLQQQFGISNDKVIADIGSGTGISSRCFLDAGFMVTGVEPNKEMREMSVELIGNNPLFNVTSGSAEQTGLASDSIDVIISGQAFHWFDVPKTRVEFKRILKRHGLVVLFWNERLSSSAFEIAYDAFIVKHATDYVKVDHRNIDIDSLTDFFAPNECIFKAFDNQQIFDFEGLKGRLLSSSYMPQIGDDGYEAMVDGLGKLFEEFNYNNLVTIHYATKVYVGNFEN